MKHLKTYVIMHGVTSQKLVFFGVTDLRSPKLCATQFGTTYLHIIWLQFNCSFFLEQNTKVWYCYSSAIYIVLRHLFHKEHLNVILPFLFISFQASSKWLLFKTFPHRNFVGIYSPFCLKDTCNPVQPPLFYHYNGISFSSPPSIICTKVSSSFFPQHFLFSFMPTISSLLDVFHCLAKPCSGFGSLSLKF